MTGKRVNTRQNTRKIYSGRTKMQKHPAAALNFSPNEVAGEKCKVLPPPSWLRGKRRGDPGERRENTRPVTALPRLLGVQPPRVDFPVGQDPGFRR